MDTVAQQMDAATAMVAQLRSALQNTLVAAAFPNDPPADTTAASSTQGSLQPLEESTCTPHGDPPVGATAVPAAAPLSAPALLPAPELAAVEASLVARPFSTFMAWGLAAPVTRTLKSFSKELAALGRDRELAAPGLRSPHRIILLSSRLGLRHPNKRSPGCTGFGSANPRSPAAAASCEPTWRC